MFISRPFLRSRGDRVATGSGDGRFLRSMSRESLTIELVVAAAGSKGAWA